jgi:two-component system nitrogen regulation response regulator GlnG
MTNESVWIVDDDSSIRWVLQKALQAADISCLSFENQIGRASCRERV